MSYGFDIRVTQNVIDTMARIETSVKQMEEKIGATAKKVDQSFNEMGETAREVGRMIGEAFALRELYEFGKELLHITAEFEGFQNVIKYSSRSIIDSQDNINYLEGAVRRLHLPLREAYEGFAEMQAGLIGTGIEGNRLRALFEGISTASTVLHLSSHSLQMVLYDFKEIGERGLNMRNMRSLMGWLPGISEIVKETFHKTFEELEKEHMTGPAFLQKLSGGLQKHFAPGLGNAGNSLQAAINDTTTALQKMELEMGENLRPLFIDIMRGIRDAFNSAPVRMFVENIRPLVQALLTAIKLWAEYKAGIYAVKLIEEARIAIMTAMAFAQGRLNVATEEGKVAMTNFQTALNSFSTGLFALGIGAAIELLMKFRAHAKKAEEAYSEMIERVTGQNKAQESIGEYPKQMDAIRAGMKDTTLMKDKKYRDDLLQRANNLGGDMQMNLAENIRPILDSTKALVDSAKVNPWLPKDELHDYEMGLRRDSATYNQAQQQIDQLKTIKQQLQKSGARTPTYDSTLGGGVEGGALSLSGLAGARGGMSEAKNIHIEFHAPLQENMVGVPEGLKRAGQQAIEVMLRALNNIAYSQSKTQ